MSKYRSRGAYHYAEFGLPTPYRDHVLDLLAKIKDHAKPGGKILEIGSGEGLILTELEKLGFDCIGCDTDRTAVDLAEKLDRAVVVPGSIEQWTDRDLIFDVVMLCDILEHVKDPIAMMAGARELAIGGIVVIAIPDRKDRHAINEITPDTLLPYMMHSCELVHRSQRHARHLMIFKRKQ